MGVDQHAQRAKRLVVFDETHPAHVGREVVNKIDIGDGAFATFLFPKIELQIFRFRKHLKPLLKRFHVDHAHFRALFEQIGDKMTANEAAPAADHHLPGCHSINKSG